MENCMEIYSDHLAKLFASENIGIEIKNTSTAYFDVKNRRMTFPTWILDLPVASRELLMLHEASHALHTPEFGTHEAAKEHEQVFRTILNILEDKRIEDAMKEKFPGAKATFIRGFFELVNKNFFGIKFQDNVNGLTLLDRMNLHFKGDYYFDCDFEDDEQYWVDRAAQNKTFEEVYQNAVELFEWMKEKYSKEVLENIQYELDDFRMGDSDGFEDGASTTLEKLRELMNSEEFEKLQEAIESGDDKTAEDMIKEKLKDDNLDFSKNNAGETDRNWENNQKNFSDSSKEKGYFKKFREPINVSLPKKIVSSDFIIDNDVITTLLSEDMSNLHEEKRDDFNKFVKEYKDSMRPIMSHMLREFYRKKAAEDYRRTKQSKTGNLDLNKLPHFKYTSDLFLNKSIILDEKNHGFVLLLDWSGSMNCIMTSAILQLINNVMFCKNIDVPFVAYAFSSEASKSYDFSIPSIFHAATAGDLRIHPNFKLLELCDSTKKNYEEQLKNLFYLAYCFNSNSLVTRSTYQSYIKNYFDENKKLQNRYSHLHHINHSVKNMVVLSDVFELGSTPLNDSLVLMNHVLIEQKRKMNVDIMNFITITDGDSDHMQHSAKEDVPSTVSVESPFIPEALLDECKDEKLNNRIMSLKSKYSSYFDSYNRNADNRNDISSRTRNQKVFIKSLNGNKIYDISLETNDDNPYDYGYQISRERTRSLARVLKEETGANVISIELVNISNNAFKKNLITSYDIKDYDEVEEMSNSYKKNGFATVTGKGYDKIFVVNTNVIGDEYVRSYYISESHDKDYLDDLETNKKGVFTTKQLTSALGKNVSQKNKRKFLATRIVDVISEKQKISA